MGSTQKGSGTLSMKDCRGKCFNPQMSHKVDPIPEGERERKNGRSDIKIKIFLWMEMMIRCARTSKYILPLQQV